MIYFEDNAGVIVNPKEMKGSAIQGPVANARTCGRVLRRLRTALFNKILRRNS